VFDRIQAADWLDAFEQLSPREKDIFMMRHVDLMEYEDMAATLGMTEGALRTALSRVKKKVERLAAHREEGQYDK
jgi:RNA polymerase sigma factor (sigma-70 family)